MKNLSVCDASYSMTKLSNGCFIVYLNGFPYVLREYADPMQNMTAFLGINAARLEKVEERLKADIMKEAKSMGGLLLVHHELCKLTYNQVRMAIKLNGFQM